MRRERRIGRTARAAAAIGREQTPCWFFIGLGLAVTVTDFLVGRHFAEMEAGRLKPRPDGSMPDIEQVNRFGRLLMLASPLFFIVLAAIGFGAIPFEGIDPVSFN